jgi:4-hydroxybenzoate polyprenyltransferase
MLRFPGSLWNRHVLLGRWKRFASRSTARRARLLSDKVRGLSTRPSRVNALVRVVRPHQWAKNALVVVPVLLAPGVPSPRHLASAALATLAFSLCASAGYVLNDFLDVEADRAHRTKRLRPFASGDLPVLYGPPLFLALFSASFGLALATLPLGFVGMLAIYFVATLAYSLVLKSKLMLDVVVLAWLYTHRVLAGGIATGIPISAWLLAFSMFMFSSLAFAKRYIELRQSMNKGGQLRSRGYHTQDLEMVASMGPTAGYIAVLVVCLYVDSSAVTAGYRAPMILWFMAPILLYWISRVWFLAHRGQMQDDPVKFALTDRLSWLCGLLVGVVAVIARFWPR